MDMLLTDEERIRFKAWLLREVETAKGLAYQLDVLKMGIGDAAMQRKFMQEAAACAVVAHILSTEEG